MPSVSLIDRDCDDFETLRGKYGTLVQSIRMISCRRTNVWTQQPQRWSTAAIGRDGRGRILFIHARSPYSTHDLIDILLELPPSTVHGIIRTLLAHGMVLQERESGRYLDLVERLARDR